MCMVVNPFSGFPYRLFLFNYLIYLFTTIHTIHRKVGISRGEDEQTNTARCS